MIWRNRGYLPHIEVDQGIYFVTFRLAESLPASLLEGWRSEREEIIEVARGQGRDLSTHEKERLNYLYLEKVEKYLDSGRGECFLANEAIAELVSEALKYFDGTRYVLHAWSVMPNHVHVLFTPIRSRDQSSLDSLLIPILHSWKSYTAKKANKILKRQGRFWQEDYFDTLVRSDRQFAFYVRYILENPVMSGLCRHWKQWRWSGCSQTIRTFIEDEVGGQDARAPS